MGDDTTATAGHAADPGDSAPVRVTLPATQRGARLDRALAEAFPTLSRERLKVLIQGGRVSTADGTVLWQPSVKVDAAMLAGPLFIDVPPLRQASQQAEDIPLVIAFEDDHLIVVDKPAGMVVHPACGNLDGTLVNALLHHCHGKLSGIGGVARPGIVHRIDKDTSGLMVAAKNDRAHEGLAKQFAAHSIEREYLAIVHGRPMPVSGTVDAPLGRSSTNRKKMAVVSEGSGKRAVTHYKTVEVLRDATLVACELETGRTHQVRVHMTHVGHPLVGDPVYGRQSGKAALVAKKLGFHRQALHAHRLGFIHPVTGKPHSFMADLPPDMQELVNALRVD